MRLPRYLLVRAKLPSSTINASTGLTSTGKERCSPRSEPETAGVVSHTQPQVGRRRAAEPRDGGWAPCLPEHWS
jgi:hypothetical protein